MASDVQRDQIIAEGKSEDRERVHPLGPVNSSANEGGGRACEGTGISHARTWRRGKVVTLGRRCRWPNPRPSANVRRLGFGQNGNPSIECNSTRMCQCPITRSINQNGQIDSENYCLSHCYLQIHHRTNHYPKLLLHVLCHRIKLPVSMMTCHFKAKDDPRRICEKHLRRNL